MKHEKIIKKIDFANECNKEIAGNFGRTMTITMEEAFLFKQLLEQQANEANTGNDKCHIQNVMRSAFKEAYEKWYNTKDDAELGNWLFAKSKGITP